MRDMNFDKADLDFLATVALFHAVGEDDLKSILGIVTVEHFEAGEIVLIEGEATNDLIILREGTLEVTINGQSQVAGPGSPKKRPSHAAIDHGS